jgi:parallel beta-helix repeat protein
MNELPRQKLCELIATYGQSLCDDPQRCENLLRDFCGAHKREIHVLVSALKERVPANLLALQNTMPPEVLLTCLSKRLQENLGLAEGVARWAIESWALALGLRPIKNTEGTFCTHCRNGISPSDLYCQSCGTPLSSKRIRVPQDVTTIQAAIDAVVDGTIITIRPGLYQENVHIQGKNLVLLKTGWGAVILEGSHCDGAVITLREAEVLIEGLTIRRGKSGVHFEANAQGRLQKIVITDNVEIGIEVSDHSKVIITDSFVSDNAGIGLRIYNSSEAEIKDGFILRNQQIGLLIEASSKADIVRNKITENGHNDKAKLVAGIMITGRSKARIDDNIIAGNSACGILLCGASQAEIRKNRISENQKNRSDGQGLGIVVRERSQALVTGNYVYGHTGAGVALYEEAQAEVVGNIITNNGPWGIFAEAGSIARGRDNVIRGSDKAISTNIAQGIKRYDK